MPPSQMLKMLPFESLLCTHALIRCRLQMLLKYEVKNLQPGSARQSA